MIKKLVYFLCAFTPFAAFGVDYYNPGTGIGTSFPAVLNIGDSVVMQSGNGMVLYNGATIAGNLYSGVDYSGSLTDQLYLETGTDTIYSIITRGNISVVGDLDVRTGRTLNIGDDIGTIDASFGAIKNAGTLNIYSIDDLTVGTIENTFNLSLSGITINTGAITNDASLEISDFTTLTMTQLVNNSDTNITGGSINTGDIQNEAGNVVINLTGDLTSTGSLENSSDSLDVTADDIIIAGSIKNDSTVGLLSITANTLTVNGGDVVNTSMANAGNFNGVITGNTYLEYGLDLSVMGTTNSFSLHTGTLGFGTGTSLDTMTEFFSNKLSLFELIIDNGNITTTNSVLNGDDGNINADMTLSAENISVYSVTNSGDELNITTDDALGGLTIGNSLINSSNSETNLLSAGYINVINAVDNSNTMNLSAVDFNFGSVTNNSGDLNISSLTTNNGIIHVNGDVVVNDGTVSLQSREIDIEGNLISNGGNTTIVGSDLGGGDIEISGIDINDGIVNINSLIGSVNVNNEISVISGILNFGQNAYDLNVGGNIFIDGDMTATESASVTAGSVYVAARGPRNFIMISNTGTIDIMGSVNAIENDYARTIRMDASDININGDVNAENLGTIVLGDTLATDLVIGGSVYSNSGGTVDFVAVNTTAAGIYSNDTGKIIARGTNIESLDSIDIGLVTFNGSDAASGLVVLDTTDLTLTVSGTGHYIDVDDDVSIGTGNKLTLSADNYVLIETDNVFVDGELDLISLNDNAGIDATTTTNNGILNITGVNASIEGVLTNNGNSTVTASDDINFNSTFIHNYGNMDITAVGDINGYGDIESISGELNITANAVTLNYLGAIGGVINLDANVTDIYASLISDGDVVQGGTTGSFNILKDDSVISASSFTVDNDFNAVSNNVEYNIANDFDIVGDLSVQSGAGMVINAGTLSTDDVNVYGDLDIISNDINLGDVIVNSGSVNINSGLFNTLPVDSFTVQSGTATLTGVGLGMSGNLTLAGDLIQNGLTVTNGDLNITANDYSISAANITANDIIQNSIVMTLNTDNLTLSGNITATDLIISQLSSTNLLDVSVAGDVSNSVDFIGLRTMDIGGDYYFDDTSSLLVNIQDRIVTAHNYWATVSLNNDNTLGQITNGVGAEALITVDGAFISDLSAAAVSGDTNIAEALADGQIGITITDTVDAGTAIWLLNATDGIQELGLKTRNVYVNYCNANGSICYNYLDSLGNGTTNTSDLPVYISVRDTNGDDSEDSLYIVFDPRFGGPVTVFEIQPIVLNQPNYTNGESVAANALDNAISGQLQNSGFNNNTPIEVIPLVFQNTNMSEMMTELYNRMEQYQLDRDGTYLKNFASLFQPSELEQIASSINVNEHTTSRDFEKYAYNEFIWNRLRNLKKSWLDADFALVNQKNTDDRHIHGDRFSITGGFDWQQSETTVLGLSARVSKTDSSDAKGNIDLTYKIAQPAVGGYTTDVSNIDVGFGGYMMKILGEKTRMYGNLFFDANILSVEREQNFVDKIEGKGTSYSLISEFGLMQDLLNQYIVGNMYTRVGYNFGTELTETAGGADYMNLKSDGYAILTPGLSLTVQKRIYTSKWFQMRPNIYVGTEYDVLGAPDLMQFKFATSDEYTDYEVLNNPWWVNTGAGIELLSANGAQFGLDYRYQYNTDIQVHKIRLSGSYRF